MPACFELKSNDDGEFYFHFLDSQGELLLMSGEYPDKEQAAQAINEVKVGSLMSNQIAAGTVADGDTFFVIKALHAVKDNACIAEINDLT